MPWVQNNAGGPASRPNIQPIIFVFVAIVGIIVYVQWQRGSLGISDIFRFAALIPSIILHEISHGALANAYGDDTAKRAGRLTLNPLRHVDPLGTFIVPGFLIFVHGPAFGWAKPVPINTARMTRNQAMFTGLVGPATNLVLAAIAAVVINTMHPTGTLNYLELFIVQLGLANVILAVFNLIPIPPLDGSAVIERFLPQRYMYTYLQFRKYSMLLFMLIMFMGSNVLGLLFNPAIDLWLRLAAG